MSFVEKAVNKYRKILTVFPKTAGHRWSTRSASGAGINLKNPKAFQFCNGAADSVEESEGERPKWGQQELLRLGPKSIGKNVIQLFEGSKSEELAELVVTGDPRRGNVFLVSPDDPKESDLGAILLVRDTQAIIFILHDELSTDGLTRCPDREADLQSYVSVFPVLGF